MPPVVVEISGWLPALIIPAATTIQLLSIAMKRSAIGVNWFVWFLFGLANLGLYIYTEKYHSYQSILGMLTPAALDFAIAGLALCRYGRKPS
jgi:hypothetical protein